MSIKKVGDTNIEQKHRLSCHCGSVVLELHLPNGIVNPRRCDCSICRRKGAVVSSVSLEDITVIKGLEHLRLYQFNTKVAKHYFCGICGIYTHHQRRSLPDQYGYNIGCLEGVNPFLIPKVPVNDGVNHPSDKHNSSRNTMKKVIGYFLFVISFIAWAAIAALPFLNLSIEMAAAITTGLIIGGEIAFFLSIALLGKEFLEKFKNLFGKFNFFRKN